MTPEDRQLKWQEQTNDLYRAYGRFAVAFEHICSNIHHTIAGLLHHEGLRNRQVSNVLLAGMTAEPLRALLIALVREVKRDLSVEDWKIFDKLMHQFQQMIGQRNDVIHSTWFIGYASVQDTDFSNASGYKHHRNKKGASVKTFDVSVSHFDSLADQAGELASLFMQLDACFAYGDSIRNSFMVDINGNVCFPLDKP